MAGLLLCMASGPLHAQSHPSPLEETAAAHEQPWQPFPLLHEQRDGGLAFDLGGSETRKLELRLTEPLLLGAPANAGWQPAGSGILALDATLGWQVDDRLRFDSTLVRAESRDAFTALGSIHCQNGILEAGSYRASDCYFVDEPGAPEFTRLSLGASYAIGDHALAAINLFRAEGSAGLTAAGAPAGARATPLLDPGLLSPMMGTSPFAPVLPGQALEYLESEASGIDLAFQVGFSTGRAGDMRLGLQLTRVLDADYAGVMGPGAGLRQWNVAEPFDSARLSFDWQRGAFSGGIQSFYREPVQFFNRDEIDSVTTFDVHFTWRTPWNASLSVGASNLLNTVNDDDSPKDTNLVDPFESIYGRIPYVRYKQDL
ncbi:MAG: TonB-dependent receptor [Xanthomonadales bacterium]|nr:TonB-dependent receptor [Xanthomonadales bacterium]NIN75992.1 TonB-dependent receptor [Xanthomonadales bacterium]NIP13033.1 TonB-dependent receptor [Xanthomonadales bacterium]NIQ36769.1 TonB-dependent receptor [Xanthomonadales bacterium]NIT34711.1 TonB-dependent receptor [Xanthomonadales bacterium]